MNQYGALFCRGVEPYLANLKALIDEADRLGLGDGSWPAVNSAKAVYEDIDGMILYVSFLGSDCERHIKEVQAAINTMTIVLRATPGASLAVPRPDAQPPENSFPTWTKFAAFGVIGVVALHYLSPLIGMAPQRRTAGYRRRSRR